MTAPKETIAARVLVREPELSNGDGLLDEYVSTAIDRILLYASLKEFPDALNSIAVEVVLAMYRRKYHEGISSEGVDVMSVIFLDSILSQYDREFSNYKKSLDDDNSNAGKLVLM